jgi:hypothetical protein
MPQYADVPNRAISMLLALSLVLVSVPGLAATATRNNRAGTGIDGFRSARSR